MRTRIQNTENRSQKKKIYQQKFSLRSRIMAQLIGRKASRALQQSMAAIYRSCNPQELLNACGKPGFQGREEGFK
jgi:hypothetical protein